MPYHERKRNFCRKSLWRLECRVGQLDTRSMGFSTSSNLVFSPGTTARPPVPVEREIPAFLNSSWSANEFVMEPSELIVTMDWEPLALLTV